METKIEVYPTLNCLLGIFSLRLVSINSSFFLFYGINPFNTNYKELFLKSTQFVRIK